jgi:ABC-type cobalamin/Fe3+-siderophores transport system ATPase subunit
MQGVPEEVLLPDLLEEVYGVSVAVEKNSLGQFTIIPQVPL